MRFNRWRLLRLGDKLKLTEHCNNGIIININIANLMKMKGLSHRLIKSF